MRVTNQYSGKDRQFICLMQESIDGKCMSDLFLSFEQLVVGIQRKIFFNLLCGSVFKNHFLIFSKQVKSRDGF